ncbi:membrane protein [Terrihabitans soli]|uniref:Membrane protein n=1 Tax=Terrihabitans soli TaxID=708113 RepID=A0A6S6QVV3_9HYPH|nr:DUF423 domain-containing protein [Terrihabitans soli]BCJ91705.1 membrane protein [Terrihabitans soli]
MSQLFIIFAGLFGALGVGFAAAAAHGGGGATLGPASQMLLFHAPALLALGLYGRASNPGLVLQAGGGAILLGVALFAGDLVSRHYRDGQSLFLMAAPSGGTIMILGWALILIAGVLLVRAD